MIATIRENVAMIATGAVSTTSMTWKYRAMQRQAEDIRRLHLDGWRQARQAADLLDGAERLILTGVGASYHAAMVSAWLFRAIGFDARAINAADLWRYPEQFPFRSTDAVIVISHAGIHPATKDTLNRARASGSTLLSVGSLSTEHEGSRLILRTVEREANANFTASHLAAMYVLAQVTQLLGERMRPSVVAPWRHDLDRLPGMIEATLHREDEVRQIASEMLDRRIFAVAAGPNEATTFELQLRLEESDLVSVEPIGLEQFLHGPLMRASEGDVAVLIRVGDRNSDRMDRLATLQSRLGMRLWVVGDAMAEMDPARQFVLPSISEALSPLLTLVPVQMLAHHLGASRNGGERPFNRFQALQFCTDCPTS
jgi:glucosamine--fructose-6-phosphate aminotransferase (isomerizing)